MKTQKFIYAIMAVTLFFVTSCSKDSIVDHNSEVNEANSETAFLENLDSESSSKSGIVFPDSHQASLDSNQEFIDFLEGDWKITQFTIDEREGRKSLVNSIAHLQLDNDGILAAIDECPGGRNGYFVFFKVHSLEKINSGVKGILRGEENPRRGGFSTYNRSLGCGTDPLALAEGFGYSLDRFGTSAGTENKEVAISIKNSLLVIGDFSKNKVIVFKKM
ncbi:hypothetical protein HN014_18920 [Aquimarina sp. TRL1]|uniref:hypothetical protein n=1 Tax=Aquimarina sp. (strain TRL1) TaxID=2736252 RepID=UPI00158CECB7|nr:hypothetical protein [Aquimarina sp. TRL1]QKX06902.1 hypothetical protein HN014_18920 [Aquimarina sp. TRL1]